jgi:hypothetical protein
MFQGRNNREKRLLKLVEALDSKEIEILRQASTIVSDRLKKISEN